MQLVRQLRQQHNQLLQHARRISVRMAHPQSAAQAQELHGELQALSAELRAHLSLEDEQLYPAMLRHRDPLVSATARRFLDEMGGLSAAYASFSARWPDAETLSKGMGQFHHEFDSVFEALTQRILAEENMLYMLGERVVESA